MQNSLVIRENDAVLNADEPLKLTALLYLREALEKESYEDCAEIVGAAKEFGAQTSDIRSVIAEYLQQTKPSRSNEANQNIRRRF